MASHFSAPNRRHSLNPTLSSLNPRQTTLKPTLFRLNSTLSNSSLFPLHPSSSISHSFLPSHHTHSSLKPYSIKVLSEEEASPCTLGYRRGSNILSDVLHHEACTNQSFCDAKLQQEAGVNQSCSNIKVHSDTEAELDALEKLVRPRRLRHSFAALPALPLPEDNVQPKRECVMLEIEWDTKAEENKKAFLHPKRYINLPKLPFGQHSSYNEETDIQGKIVSQRSKAWKRQQTKKLLPKRSF